MTTLIAELIHRIPLANTLGEGIQWNAARGEIWWTDILDNKLYAYHWQNKSLNVYHMPESVCSFAFIKNDTQLLIAFATGIAFYQLETQRLNWIHENLCDGITQRLNDGRVDRAGRFWVGSMVLSAEKHHQNTGQLFCLNQDLSLDIKQTNIQISNGLCWSKQGDIMYFADSPKQTITRYALDASNNYSSQHMHIQTPTNAYPDGANVDSNNNLWSAHWAAGQVVRYNPAGEITATLNIPASQPTCIAFGGEDLSLLFVTSATQDLSDSELNNQPRAGDVFVYSTNAQGLPENQFIINSAAQR